MSISLVGTATYTGDSAAAIDNVLVGGALSIVRLTTTTNQQLHIKAASGNLRSWSIATGTPSLQYQLSRVTTNCSADAALSNFSQYRLGTWMVMACRWDTGTSANNELFLGQINGPLLRPSAYITQTNGVGSTGDDSASPLIIGNNNGGAKPVTDNLFAGAFFNLLPTVDELLQTARALLTIGRAPVLPGSCARAYRFDRGLGTLVCLKSQNTLVPSGTITTAADPRRPRPMTPPPGVLDARSFIPTTAGGIILPHSRARRLNAQAAYE